MKILIADPHLEVQSALRLTLNRLPDITGIGEANNLVQLLAQCAGACPDLILFDLELLQPSRGHARPLADLVRVFQRLCPCAKVVIMSSRLEAEQEAWVAGASGFISKTDSPDVVLSTIARVLENRS